MTLPPEFPGWAEARQKTEPKERVAALESAFQAKLGDNRFLPYIQLHEFEALLYCDLSQLQQRITDSKRAFAATDAPAFRAELTLKASKIWAIF